MQERTQYFSKQQIAEFLPRALQTALESYHAFMTATDIPEDAKGFSAHHSAARAAIAHIELLIKLARWADLADETAEGQDQSTGLARIIARASAEIEAHGRNGDCPDDPGSFEYDDSEE